MVLDHEEDIEEPERYRRDAEEIHGREHVPVVGQKRPPRGAGWAPRPKRPHVPGHRALRDPKAELEQFPVDPWRSPAVLLHHAPYFIHLREGRPFGFAGIWSPHRTDIGQRIGTCCASPKFHPVTSTRKMNGLENVACPCRAARESWRASPRASRGSERSCPCGAHHVTACPSVAFATHSWVAAAFMGCPSLTMPASTRSPDSEAVTSGRGGPPRCLGMSATCRPVPGPR
jgi:hypothetical protein